MGSGEIVAAFDRLASRYDEWYRTPLGAFADARQKETIFALAEVGSGELALDVGCGTGNYTLALARRRADAVGVDPAAAMLVLAARKVGEAGRPARFARAVAENLPFPTASFDLVVSVTTLEFVGSPQAAVAEMVRVVRPGGRLVIGTLNACSLWTLAYRRLKGSVYEQARFFSPPALVALLRPYGPVVWRSCVFVPPWYHRPPERLGHLVERMGARSAKLFGAFLAGRVVKKV